MSEIALVYALYGDRAPAELAALQMVERRLAACANILASCTSIYEWEGEIRRDKEYPVIFKTARTHRLMLTAALAAAHDYAVPAISSWVVATTADYAEWVETQIGKSA